MSVKKCLGGAGLSGLIVRLDSMGTGQCGYIDGLGREARMGVPALALEGRRAVATTNSVGAARVESIFSRADE